MIALMLAALLSAAPERQVEAEAGFVYGAGSRSSFGGLISSTTQFPVWQGRVVSGSLQVGLLVGYQNEPSSLTAGFLTPARVTGSNHRTEVFVTLGHAVRWLRLRVGAQVFAGWTQLVVSGTLVDEARGLSITHRAVGSEMTIGVMAHAGVQLSERLGLTARLLVPVPYAGLSVSSYLMLSIGITLAL